MAALLLILFPGACGSDLDQDPGGSPLAVALHRARERQAPVLVHFAARDLDAGLALATRTFEDPASRTELDREVEVLELDALEHPDLFRELFGEAGRLGCGFLSPDGQPMASLPGCPTTSEVTLWARRVARYLEAWNRSEGQSLERARVLARLHSWARTAEGLTRLLDGQGDRPLSPLEEREVRSILARAQARRGRTLEARSELLALERHGPLGPFDELTMALLALQEGAYAESHGLMARLELDGEQEQARLLAFATATHAARLGDGLDLLDRLLERYPRSPWRAAALRQVDHVLNPQPGHTH